MMEFYIFDNIYSIILIAAGIFLTTIKTIIIASKVKKVGNEKIILSTFFANSKLNNKYKCKKNKYNNKNY